MNLIDKNREKFDTYYKFLVEENEKYNLTNITEVNEVNIKHFFDSLSMKDIIDLNQKISLCDVGSGAGFPAIPLKICFPNLDVTIIEPTTKRTNFLKMLCDKLGIEVTIINERCEDVARDLEESFDIVTARAVANTSILLELLSRITKVNGNIVLYKGDKATEELKDADKAIKILDLSIAEVYPYELPENYGSRYLINLKKNKKTKDCYPRRYAEIKKKPL